jgi:hypothetical protein
MSIHVAAAVGPTLIGASLDVSSAGTVEGLGDAVSSSLSLALFFITSRL